MPYEEGAGTNANVYFVCNYLGGPMTQLPFVTPDQIKAARLLKKLLTGAPMARAGGGAWYGLLCALPQLRA